MKQVFRKIILLAICITVSTVIFAQGTEWGVKAGVNIATQIPNITKITNGDIRTGAYVGLFAERRFSNFFGLQGEILYSEMGGKNKQYYGGYPSGHYGEGDYVEGELTFTSKNDYIVLPVLAKLYVAKKLSIDLGPQFAYMVGDKTEEDPTHHHYGSIGEKFDVLFGAGLSYKLGRFDISARYNLGLVEIYDCSWRNNVIQFGVGYRIK